MLVDLPARKFRSRAEKGGALSVPQPKMPRATRRAPKTPGIHAEILDIRAVSHS